MSERFEKLKQKILETIKDSKVEEDPRHSQLVCEWLLKLNRESSDLLQIAALAHDIERAVQPRTEQEKGEAYDNYKQRHAHRSAEITANLMVGCGYDAGSIKEVKKYIQKHEVGGSEQIDLLRDADSVAYFDYNVDLYLKRNGLERSKEKIRFMFSRASERAQREILMLNFSPEVQEAFNEVIKR